MLESSRKNLEKMGDEEKRTKSGLLGSPNSEWTQDLAPCPYLEQVLTQCGLWCEMTHVTCKLS